MPESLTIQAAAPDPALLDLPWHLPLENWPEEIIAALPRGISRHTVRFVNLSGRIIAIKEIAERPAHREYSLLRDLVRLDVPSVTPVGVVTGRTDAQGEPLDAALITQHLRFSLPYRALFAQRLRPKTAERLIHALALLMVRLHLNGFYWGDISLSNTLFRRDADSYAAYLVDAETGDLHDYLTKGQRLYDLDLARTNIIGELMDLEAGELLEEAADPIDIGNLLVKRYKGLWKALTQPESFDDSERWRVAARIQSLNDLGFDVAEMSMVATPDGRALRIEPKVVEAGYHSRRLFRLTGLDTQQRQARRLLNDLDTYRCVTGRQNDDEELCAHEWLTRVFEPTIQAVPWDLRAKLEPAQVFHEILDHRWFMAQRDWRDVPMSEAAESYVNDILRHRRDERELIQFDTRELPPVPELE